MWEEIKKNGIVTYTTNAHGKFASTIPEGTAALSASRMVQMIQWIYDEFVQDSAGTPDVFASTNFAERDAFVIRNTSRVLSYINHVCALEHILVRLYGETIAKLQVIDPTIASDTTALTARETEVADCFTFRNKVSAHTAYGSPRKEDNSAMEFHSLVTMLSTSYDGSGKADSFALGAVSVRLGGQDPSTKLPCLGLKELHPKITEHIKQWTSMFTTPCAQAQKKVPLTVGDTSYVIE